uniref:Uncharacterized protein n=1 Tax=Parascaris univalens TaxID=6257 RepID=A0A915CCL0_PARUN
VFKYNTTMMWINHKATQQPQPAMASFLRPSVRFLLASLCEKNELFAFELISFFLFRLYSMKVCYTVTLLLHAGRVSGNANWACGNNALVENATYFINTKVCPATVAMTGECCEEHDECYRITTNSKRCCDSAFCSCLRRSAKQEPWHRYVPCLIFAEISCTVVKQSGHEVFKPYKEVPATCP